MVIIFTYLLSFSLKCYRIHVSGNNYHHCKISKPNVRTLLSSKQSPVLFAAWQRWNWLVNRGAPRTPLPTSCPTHKFLHLSSTSISLPFLFSFLFLLLLFHLVNLFTLGVAIFQAYLKQDQVNRCRIAAASFSGFFLRKK